MFNIQPVIPVRVSENWTLIARIIQPIVGQPYPSEPTGGQYGFGDMNPTFFLSPAKPGKLIGGGGPAFVCKLSHHTTYDQLVSSLIRRTRLPPPASIYKIFRKL